MIKMQKLNAAILTIFAWLWIAPLLGASTVVINEIFYHPASEDTREEFIELYNTDATPANLSSWRISRGVDFTFPDVTISPHGFLVLAADLAVFKARHPDVTNVIGGWQGTLSHRGETIQLDDAFGVAADTVSYATEGDWAVRQRGPLDFDYRGWVWVAEHDGGGKSLELINPAMNRNAGQNWQASLVEGGTPGSANSVARADSAPLITEVQHLPAVPRSTETVRVTARVEDELAAGVTVSLFYRNSDTNSFVETALFDDGQHADGKAGDGLFGANLPPQPSDTVVELYLRAADAGGNERFWPARVQPENAPLANLLYQVDDRTNNTAMPFYRLVMTENERAEFLQMVNSGYGRYSNARMNGTFIASRHGETEVRYLAGIRNRGSGSRLYPPNNFRIEFANDRRWDGVDKINLNARYPFVQLVGSVLCQMANLPYPHSQAAQVRLNHENWAGTNYPMYGFYVHNECLDSDFADRRALGSINIYRGIREGDHYADLTYQGENPDAYRPAYAKETNKSEDDWTDLISLTRILSATNAEAEYYPQMNAAVKVDEWLRFFALNAIFDNNETTISSGSGDDYALYRDLSDNRFVLFPYDLDTILGQGDLAGSPSASLFRATNLPIIKRFLLAPEYTPRYYAQLLDLLDTTFAANHLDPVLRQALTGLVPDYFVTSIESFVAARSQYIRSQIPRSLTVAHGLPSVNNLPYSSTLTIALNGVSDAVRTRKVLVNGQPAAWSAVEAKWSLDNLALQPGINRVLIQAIDETGMEFDRSSLDVWCNPGTGGSTIQGTLSLDTVWESANGPYQLTGEVVVPENGRLKISPGTTLYFAAGSRLTVRGQILLEGTETARIRLTCAPGESSPWGGLLLLASSSTNRLEYCDLEYSDALGRSIEIRNAALELQNVTWSHTARAAILFDHASLRVKDCVFPTTINDDEVRGNGILEQGLLLFERNVFPKLASLGQAIRFEGEGTSLCQCRDNFFLGGTESAIRLANADAYVEGNRFASFHGSGDPSAAALSVLGGPSSRVVVARNLFTENDCALLVCSNSWLIAHHNTFVQNSQSDIAFTAPSAANAPAAGAELVGNIFNSAAVTLAATELLSTTNLVVEYNLFPPGIDWVGAGNLNGDPLFVSANTNYLLEPGSPAKGNGRNGLDMGYDVPAGVSLSGVPISPTPALEVDLRVWGPGMATYQYQLDAGSVSTNYSVTENLVITNLTAGSHTLNIVGQTLFGTKPSGASPTLVNWEVNPTASAILLNEVCAWNTSSNAAGVIAPNWMEIHNRTGHAIHLGDMSLSDDANIPTRYVFPADAVLPAQGYLVINDGTTAIGERLGFALDRTGGTLYLFGAPSRGGQLLDTLAFGYQLPGMSMGRLNDGTWHLTRPTPGSDNQSQPVGDLSQIRINEWLASATAPHSVGFIELYNSDALPVDLRGLLLSDDPVSQPFKFAFPALSFMDGYGRLVMWENDAKADPHFRLNFKLNSDQGVIGLSLTDGTSLDRIWYGTQQTGVSQGKLPDGGLDIVSFNPPSPGLPNSEPVTIVSNTPIASVMINEILADNHSYPDQAGTLSDWIELYNASAAPVNLAGMVLTDRLDVPRTWAFATGTTLPAQGYLRVTCDPDQPASANNTGFGLNAAGDSIYLLRAAADGGGIIDGVQFGFQSPDLSLGRDPAGAYVWRPCEPTPAASNRPRGLGEVQDLRINEWMANPLTGEDWLELFNSGNGPVDMGGLFLTDGLSPSGSARIPDLSFIDAGYFAYRQFYADGNTGNGANHLDFKLSSGGEALVLLDTRGNIIDRVVFSTQTKGQATGRVPDGSTHLTACVATPGRMNIMDSDADGLPDAWETLYGLNPYQAGDHHLDSDGDGFDNLLEYLCGTDPRDARSHLNIESITNGPEGFELRFTAVAGKTYMIEYTSSLPSAVWNPLASVAPRSVATAIVITDKNPIETGTRFYRLVIP
jgi:hypothetical protein